MTVARSIILKQSVLVFAGCCYYINLNRFSQAVYSVTTLVAESILAFKLCGVFTEFNVGSYCRPVQRT